MPDNSDDIWLDRLAGRQPAASAEEAAELERVRQAIHTGEAAVRNDLAYRRFREKLQAAQAGRARRPQRWTLGVSAVATAATVVLGVALYVSRSPSTIDPYAQVAVLTVERSRGTAGETRVRFAAENPTLTADTLANALSDHGLTVARDGPALRPEVRVEAAEQDALERLRGVVAPLGFSAATIGHYAFVFVPLEGADATH